MSVGWSNDYVDRQRDERSHRLDKPIVVGQIKASVVGASAAVALIACVPLSLLSGWRAAAIHLTAVFMAWLYNFKLKMTIVSVVPYIVAFGLLPVFVTLGLPQHPWPSSWAIMAASLLGCGAHFVNVLPDLESDRDTGVIGLPHRFGYTTSLKIGAILISTSLVVVAIFSIESAIYIQIGLVALSLCGAIGIFIAGFTGRPRFAWTLTLCLAGVSVAALLVNGGSLIN